MAQVKKLSVATVYGKIDLTKLIDADKLGQPLKIMRCIGHAVGVKSGTSSYGEWTALLGQFAAINLETGVESRASQLFLPAVALLPIQTALQTPDAKGVDFAIDVFAVKSQSNKPGAAAYEYTFEPLIEAAAGDPVARIMAMLPAPASTAAPAPTPAPTPAAAAATRARGK